MKEATRILIVEDKSADADLAKHAIQKVLEVCEFLVVETQADFLNALKIFQPEVILSDYSLPRFDGMKALNLALAHAPLTPLIIWTGSISEDVAVECMKAGANNYILKDNIKRLGPALLHALEERQLLLERKQAEEALQKSEKRFRALIENGLDNISLLSADGTLMWESPATFRTLDYAPDQFVGSNIFELMHPDDLEWTRHQFVKLLHEPESHQRGTFRLHRSDGTWRWVEAIATNMLNEPGVNAIVINYRDVTERKQTEEALRESQIKYRNLVETSYDLIWSVDTDGRFTFINRAAKEIYGYEPEELIGRSFFEIIDPEHYRQEDFKNFKETIARLDESKDVETYVRHRDGRQIILSANSIVLRDNDGNVIGVTGTSHDITKRKRMEEIVRDDRNLLRTLIDNIPDRIYAMDIQGRKTLSNTADWKASGGKTMEDVIGKTDFDTYPPELAEGFWRLDKAVLDAGQPVINFEEPGLDFEGNPVSILTTKIPLHDEEGKVIGLVGIGRDITERKQVEKKLQLSDQILQRVSALVLVADSQGNIVYVSPSAKIILGYEPEELLGDNWWKLSRSMSIEAQAEKEYVGRAAHGEVSIAAEAYERPIQDRWGNIHWISWVDTAGPGDLLIGVGHDVTERKQAEARINDLLAFNEKILNHSPLGILTYKTTGECVFANQNVASMVGTTIEQLMAQNFHTIESWKQSGLYDLVEQVSRTNTPITSDIHLFSTFGKDIWITVHCVTFKSKDEDHILLSVSDITERKQAEEALRESENRLILALSGAQMSVWEWNLQTNSILWSPEFFEITGVREEDFGRTFESFTNLVHADDVARVMASAEKAVTEKSLFAEEFRIIRPDSEVRWISNLGHAEYDSINNYLRLIGTVQDITPRKQAELERQALLEIMQGFANTTDLQELLELIHHSIAKVIYAENLFVVLYQQNSGLFEEIYSVDQYDPPAPPSRLEKSITSYVFRSGEPLLLTQEGFDELAAQGEVELIGTNSASWLGVPLKTSGKTMGVIAVQDYVYSNRYTEREKDFLVSIATQVALAIERKQAEDVLHKSEALYRRAMEAAGAVPYLESYYNEGRSIKYEFIGEGIRQITGYGPEEFNEALWDSLVEEVNLVEDLAGYSLDDGLQQVRMGENSNWKCEHRLRDRDGKTHWVFEAAVELRDENGIAYGSIGTYQDITKRKQAEEAEREQRALAEALRDTAETLSSSLSYEEVLDHILAAVGRVVPHDAATVMLIEGESARVVRMYGYDKRGFDFEIMGIQLPLAKTNNMRQMLETGQPVVVYDTHSYPGWVRLDATDWLRSNVGAPISIQGKVIGFILLDGQTPDFFTPVHAERLEAFANQAAIAIHNARLLQQAQEEIAERKQAEEELRASEERFRQLADNIQEAFWITNADSGEEIYLSSAAETIWGHSIEELSSRPNAFMESILPEDQSGVLEALEKQRMGEKVEIEYRIMKPDGSLSWIWDRAFPIFDDSGKVKRIAGITADITERRKADEALQQSEEKYRRLAEQMPAVVYVDLADGSGNTIYISPGVEKMLGYTPQAWLEKPDFCTEVIHPEDRERVLNEGVNAEAKGLFNLDYRYISMDGQIVWVHDEAVLIGDETGQPRLWQGIIVDITERKRAEEEIRRRAEETSALLRTSLALTNLDLSATLQTIGNSAKTLFAADGCRIFLMQPDNESLRCVLALQENSAAFLNLRIKSGEGVTGAVAASGRAEIVNAMQNDPRGVQVPGTLDKEEEAIMFAPLKERDRTIGVLSVRHAGTERPFSSDDLELLEAFASMAASAVSNARLFEETQHRLSELEALYENGLAVGRLLKPGEIGDRVINTFARYLPWHHVTIRLRKEESDELELVAFNLPDLKEEKRAETEQHFIALINQVGQGLSGWVIQTGLPLRTGNVHNHPQYIDTHAGIQSGLYMPLKVGEWVIGVISVESEIPDAFTEQDERLLATLANQAAIAFENARLYETIQKELSERKRIEKDLRVSEVHYRELADSITDILFELDQDLHYTHWNRASEMLTGILAKDAIGKSMHEIFGESEEQTRISQIYEGVLKNLQPRTFETVLLLNGQKRSFEINAYPSTRGVSVVANDVTERKQSETIMQKRFELMEFSAHHTLDELMQKTTDEVSELTGSSIGFFHFVEEDQTTLRMQTWSTNALQLFHVPVSEGTHLSLDKAGVWAEAARQRRPLIQNNYGSLSRKRGLPQGHTPITREMVIPIIRNERIMAIMGIANNPQDYTQHDLEIAERLADYAWDITERKQMEVALEAERNQLAQRVDERTADLSRANSNLARALRVKDEFLANMSHELRTPLNAILGLSESLGEQIAGPLNEKQQKYIATIGESGHHLLSLINDILDLAKIDAGQITLDINKVDIHSVCQASLRMIKQLAQKKNQEVFLEIDEGLGVMWADERRLKQMIVNLLGNAVKFTPENGRLGLEVHGDEEANKISFTVWDRGIGIREEDLARLFQPFVQLDSGLARETTGTGLGLALVAQMARLHGGSITTSSEPENGSRFTIVLPWEPALVMDAAARMKITGKFRAIKLDEKNQPIILLVEDTKEVTMMIKDYLELTGYKVVTAQDGVDAIVQAKLVRPDLILMDVQMPRMDGFEATRKLRSEPDFRYTPIIALTALAMPNDRERCLEAGMDEYISKPVNLKALAKIIQVCLFSAQEPKSK
jgi:PAS domain S-box-containing protein